MQPATEVAPSGAPRAEASERIRALEAAKRQIEAVGGCAELIEDLDGKIRALKDNIVAQRPLPDQLAAAIAFAERKRIRLEEVNKAIAELRGERVQLGETIATTADRIVDLQRQVAEQQRANAEQQRARVMEPIAPVSEEACDDGAQRARLVVEALRSLPGMPQAALELIGSCPSPVASPAPFTPVAPPALAAAAAATPAAHTGPVQVFNLEETDADMNEDDSYGPVRAARRPLSVPYDAAQPAAAAAEANQGGPCV